MRPDVYKEYCRSLRLALEEDKFEFDDTMLCEKPTDTVTCTIKNYKIPGGFSTRIHERGFRDTYTIYGPLGIGLNIDTCGTHVVFTAGNGIQAFIDLVAHVARRLLGLLSQEEEKMLDPSFRLVVFASFQTRECSICLDFLELI